MDKLEKELLVKDKMIEELQKQNLELQKKNAELNLELDRICDEEYEDECLEEEDECYDEDEGFINNLPGIGICVCSQDELNDENFQNMLANMKSAQNFSEVMDIIQNYNGKVSPTPKKNTLKNTTVRPTHSNISQYATHQSKENNEAMENVIQLSNLLEGLFKTYNFE